MPSPITWLSQAGSRLSDGTPNTNGLVWCYVPGTTTLATVYKDEDGASPHTQPIALDAAGRPTPDPIFASTPIKLLLEDSSGTIVQESEWANEVPASAVEVENPGFTGTDSDGTVAAGNRTDLDAVLDSAYDSVGGLDFKYLETTGATGMKIKDALGEIHVSASTRGAGGNDLTDDTAALAAAISRASATRRKRVFIGAGTYRSFSPLVMANGVSIYGAGRDATVLKNMSTTTSMFTASSGVDNWSIRDLGITADTVSTGSAIMATSSHVDVTACKILNHRVGVLLTACVAARVRDCQIDYEGAVTGYGVHILGASALCVVEGNHFTGRTGSAGNGVTVGGSGGGHTVQSNYIQQYLTAIEVPSTFTGIGVWVAGNYFVSTPGGGGYHIDLAAGARVYTGFHEMGNVRDGNGPITMRDNTQRGIWMSQTVGRFPGGFRGSQAPAVLSGAGVNNFTPDLFQGNEFTLDVSGGAAASLNLVNPTNATAAQERGTRMMFKIHITGGGLTASPNTITGGTAYVGLTGTCSFLNVPNPNAAGTNINLEFEWDDLVSKWRLIGYTWGPT